MSNVRAYSASDRTGIAVRGSERTRWLNGLVTSDLAKRGPHEVQYGLIVEKKGRIVADYFAVPAADESFFVLAVPKKDRDSLITMLDHFLVMEDAELSPIDLHFWHLLGKDAPMHDAPFGGRIDWLGLGGGAIVAAPDESLAAKLRASADVTILDEPAFEALRIEQGVPRFGVEVDATLYPQEAALERRAVAFDKGCYLGQEVVYMLENRGHVKRKLVPLRVEGDVPLEPGAPIANIDGAAVGDVKSSAIGPSGRPSAIAMVKWASSKPGTELRAGDRPVFVRET
jgi:tRNA-modifying protein YgfZ